MVTRYDVMIVGAGIMGATLATLINELEPTWKVGLVEAQGEPALESSNAWNNAGTGHAGLCELNYTPQVGNAVPIKKAVEVNAQFQQSLQAWGHWAEQGKLKTNFITKIPHMSWVKGYENIEYLRERHHGLSHHPFFSEMEFTDNPQKVKDWAPLLNQGRSTRDKVAATYSSNGTDVDYGLLTSNLLETAKVDLFYDNTVKQIKRWRGGWRLHTTTPNGPKEYNADFVFIGAGGATLPLLQRTKINEINGYGGFPISGQFLYTTDPYLVNNHDAKVYGQAEVGAPPMSVPHLDKRMIDGKPALLFGPYAGFSPKFLKLGSPSDLFRSLRPHNLVPMLQAARMNSGLTWYLIKSVLASPKKRFKELQKFYPAASSVDWQPLTAGQRVQVIRPDGSLQFGTETIVSADGSMSGLLGASPGASVSVPIMVDLLMEAFAEKRTEWEGKVATFIPSYGVDPHESPKVFLTSTETARERLGL